MSDPKLSNEFFEKGIKSVKLAHALLTTPGFEDYASSSIGEMFHGFELMLKGQIAKHSKFLLIEDIKGLVDKSWKVAKFDELNTKQVSQLPKILFAIEELNPKFSFLKNEYSLIEQARRERNKYEHSAAQTKENYISLVIAPFFHKVILKMVDAIDPAGYSVHFDSQFRLDLVDKSDEPSKLLKDPNRFYDDCHSCPICFHEFAFLSKDRKNLHCLICDTDVVRDLDLKFASCPICEQELISYGLHIKCLGECRTYFVPVTKLAAHENCECLSDKISNLKGETGNEEGLCLKCLSTISLWECDHCYQFFTKEQKEEPPPEIHGDNLCENCSPNVWDAYKVE